jgi:hypothetical protein
VRQGDVEAPPLRKPRCASPCQHLSLTLNLTEDAAERTQRIVYASEKGRKLNALCPTCNKEIAYPFCVNQFHSQPVPNPVVDELKSVLERISGWWR